MPLPIIVSLVVAAVFFLLSIWNFKKMMDVRLIGFSDISKYQSRSFMLCGMFAVSFAASIIMLIVWLVRGTL